MATIIAIIASFVIGILVAYGYVIYRMMRSDGWDKSNITNAFRLLAHVSLHPEDFAKMRYPDGNRPFWYVGKDELSEVVETRPKD